MVMRPEPKFLWPSGATTVPQLREAARQWAKNNKDIPAKELEQLVSAFIQSPSALKKCMGGILLGYMPAQRSALDPLLYEEWLDHTAGWAAVDAICYANFTAGEILRQFTVWKTLIEKLAKSPNDNKRRAALVLLTKPVKESDDRRLCQLAFAIIDSLRAEQSILITKAISWLLRNLVKLHREEVRAYLEANKEGLPKIAVRETENKLRHGRKSGR